jgi:hypothetical protein
MQWPDYSYPPMHQVELGKAMRQCRLLLAPPRPAGVGLSLAAHTPRMFASIISISSFINSVTHKYSFYRCSTVAAKRGSGITQRVAQLLSCKAHINL